MPFTTWLKPGCLLTQLVVLLGLCTTSAFGQTRMTFSPDGSEVTDSKSGLTWRRCAEGLVWSGTTCTGALFIFTHESALARAQTQTGWRLPNIKELSSLVDTTVRVYPSIDGSAFPLTPSGVYWSATPDTRAPSSAWTVDFSGGRVVSTPRNTFNGLIRLVR